MNIQNKVINNKAVKRRILLLQGPVGPFFKNLHKGFLEHGFDVKRVLFNRADRLFSHSTGCVEFSGNEKRWRLWLTYELKVNRPDVIIFFGSSRPAHEVAREVATALNIKLLSFEEGYLRSGYITCEENGNNQYSPLCNLSFKEISEVEYQPPLSIPSPFLRMCIWAATYYGWRDLTNSKVDELLYHRKTKGIIKESISWISNALNRSIAKFKDAKVIGNLLSQHAKKYILVPLQTPTDSQLQKASRGWSNEKLIKSTIDAYSSSGSKEFLVFKTHPLDEKAEDLVHLIQEHSNNLNCNEKVLILRSGKMGELAHNSSGLIVINSTSAFSALHHNVPLLVMGDALFRHDCIATIGDSPQSIFDFLLQREVKDKVAIDYFFDVVKNEALIPGDFYISIGRQAATKNVIAKVDSLTNSTVEKVEFNH